MDIKSRLEELVKIGRNRSLTTKEGDEFAFLKRKMKASSFKQFCKAIRPTFKWAWFHEYLQETIGDCFINKKGRLITKMPQQHGKSELMGRCAIAYAFGKFPEWKILYLTFSDSRAKEISADALKLIVSEEYQEIFPNVKLKDETEQEVRTARKRASKLSIANFSNVNSMRGEFKAAGIKGGYNGYDANVIILDDFFSGHEQANSQVTRDSVWNAFANNVLTRQQKHVLIFVMSTQWHDDDVIGRLEKYMATKPKDAPDWTVIQFNALKDERDYPYDPREVGEYLWAEERMDVYLEKQAIDPIGWEATYQNNPMSLMGNIFDLTCFRMYDHLPHTENMKVIISVDPNYKKDSKEGDPCAIVVLGIMGSNVYLLEFSLQAKVDIIDNVGRIKYVISKYSNYYAVVVEQKGQGEDICTILRSNGIVKVIGFDPGNKSKIFRAQQMIPYCRAGQFYLPSANVKYKDGSYLCPEINKFINEFMNFTGFKGGMDNLVDATSQVFIAFDYLLKPAFLSQTKFTVQNRFSTGKSLNRITNPMLRINNEQK